jgi:hypothetical protein
MKTYYLFFGLVLSVLVACQSRGTKESKVSDGKKIPEEKVVVNRKYDKKGNLIEFDSTYTSYYSNFNGDTIGLDSTMQNFGLFFSHHFPSISSHAFMDMDSSITPGFFHDDFFEHGFIKQDEKFLKVMREMDSIKNEFFKYHFNQQEGEKR